MKKIFTIFILLSVLGVGWYLASPLLFDKEVDEAFPLADMTIEEYEEMKNVLASIGMDAPSEEKMRTMTKGDIEELEMEMLAASEEQATTTNETMSFDTDPIVFAEADFMGADDFHRASGTATLYQLPDNDRVLRFEDFEVANGPDLRVLLVAHPDPTDADDVEGRYVELGKLKGNKGNQNYDVPADIDLSQYNSVVIYCKPFHVIFATALLE